MDPNFGSIKMTLIFQKDCITSMDPKFGSIKMNLIFWKDWITSVDPKSGSITMNLIVQIYLKKWQVFSVKIWIHTKWPVPGSIKMDYNLFFGFDVYLWLFRHARHTPFWSFCWQSWNKDRARLLRVSLGNSQLLLTCTEII